MGKLGFFEVWVSVGVGLRPGPEFNELAQALRYVGAHLDDGAFAIRLPNGRWFENPEGGILFSRLGDATLDQLPDAWMPPARGHASRLAPLGVTKGGFWLGEKVLKSSEKTTVKLKKIRNPAYRRRRAETERGLGSPT